MWPWADDKSTAKAVEETPQAAAKRKELEQMDRDDPVLGGLLKQGGVGGVNPLKPGK